MYLSELFVDIDIIIEKHNFKIMFDSVVVQLWETLISDKFRHMIDGLG